MVRATASRSGTVMMKGDERSRVNSSHACFMRVFADARDSAANSAGMTELQKYVAKPDAACTDNNTRRRQRAESSGAATDSGDHWTHSLTHSLCDRTVLLCI